MVATLPDLTDHAHRPWPLPRRPWLLRMQWHDLLFAHWPVAEDTLRALVPASLELDRFQGQAWLGVVPFRMSGVAPRGFPDLPGVSSFLELNVRTYVVAEDRPGVWFFSLDAASRLAVRVARGIFHLPYFDADMSLRRDGEDLEYSSRRTHRGAAPAVFRARYGPTGPVEPAPAGTLEHWLTERYCLYAAQGDRLWRGDIHHGPWPLQPAHADLQENRMGEWLGLGLDGPPASLLFARTIPVVGWRNQRVEPPQT